jgi:hypothetical protein
VQKSRLNDASKIRAITVTINKMGIVKKMITVMVVNKVKAIATTVDSMIKVKNNKVSKIVGMIVVSKRTNVQIRLDHALTSKPVQLL